ncbi:MAG: DUF1016 family protein [Bacteroidales bacterium]|nr:DUF1016 family protein [Candidatus Physcocola equi]
MGKGSSDAIRNGFTFFFSKRKRLFRHKYKYIKRWYLFYNESNIIGQQVVDQLEMPEKFALVPWRTHIVIFTKCKSVEEALFYVDKTIEGNWSRAVLEQQIKSDLYARQGCALTNFSQTLPESQMQKAREVLKDPYCFDFLTMRPEYEEKDIEDALISNITKFLLELGKGFAFVGRQMELRMPDGNSYFPDLVFYHIPLKSYVVIDLKAVDFKPEFVVKINFYVSAVDHLMKGDGDNDTIGLIICKTSDKTTVEWSFNGVNRPLGVATYELKEVVERTVAEMDARNSKENDEVKGLL